MYKKYIVFFFILLNLNFFFLGNYVLASNLEDEKSIVLQRIDSFKKYDLIKHEMSNKVYDKPLTKDEENITQDILQSLKIMFEPHGLFNKEL